MSTKTKLIALMAVSALLVAAPAHAGILNNHLLAFNNGAGPGVGGAWTGSDVYDNGLASPFHLVGNLDYAVFTAGAFGAAFPASPYVPGAALVYTYQIENQGDFAVSAQIVGISTVANTIGSFQNAVGEVAPSAQVFDSGGNAIWFFSSPNIGTGQDSYILAYSSPNIPVLGAAVGVTVDGGTFGLTTVPTPSSTPIPEPATLGIAGLGLISMLLARRRMN